MPELFIPVPPIPKGRPRMTRRGKAYTPKRTLEYEALVRAEWVRILGDEPTDMPVAMDMVFDREGTYIDLRELTTDHTSVVRYNPDLTNLSKAVEDALNGVAYVDDKQIVRLSASKLGLNF